MTPKQSLIQTQALLSSETCRCAAVPIIQYEPGVTFIECARCGNSAAVPDFDLEGCLEVWRAKNL